MSDDQRLDYLDFVKLCLLFIVMASHSIEVANDDWFHLGIASIPALKYISGWFSTFHVQSFTMISGYLYYYLRVEKGKYEDIKRFVLSKSKRLIIPCIFILCVWIIPINSILFHMDLMSIIHSFVLLENPSQLWFLIMLFGVFIIARYVGEVADKQPHKWICIILVAYLVGIVGDKFFPNIFQLGTILQFLSFFYLGYYYRRFLKHGIERYWWVLLLADLALYMLYKAPIINQPGYYYFAIRTAIGFVLSVIGCLMSFTILGKLGKSIYIPGGGITYFVKRSMVMYLVHNQFNFLTVNMIYSVLPTWAIIVVSFIITVICSIIFSSILLHFRTTRMLVGE